MAATAGNQSGGGSGNGGGGGDGGAAHSNGNSKAEAGAGPVESGSGRAHEREHGTGVAALSSFGVVGGGSPVPLPVPSPSTLPVGPSASDFSFSLFDGSDSVASPRSAGVVVPIPVPTPIVSLSVSESKGLWNGLGMDAPLSAPPQQHPSQPIAPNGNGNGNGHGRRLNGSASPFTPRTSTAPTTAGHVAPIGPSPLIDSVELDSASRAAWFGFPSSASPPPSAQFQVLAQSPPPQMTPSTSSSVANSFFPNSFSGMTDLPSPPLPPPPPGPASASSSITAHESLPTALDFSSGSIPFNMMNGARPTGHDQQPVQASPAPPATLTQRPPSSLSKSQSPGRPPAAREMPHAADEANDSTSPATGSSDDDDSAAKAAAADVKVNAADGNGEADANANGVDFSAQIFPKNKQELYKTEICQNWLKNKACSYGNKCHYAHGKADLRPRKRIQTFRTQPCADPARAGCHVCMYGTRCNYGHPGEPLRRTGPSDRPYYDDEYHALLRRDFPGNDAPFGMFV